MKSGVVTKIAPISYVNDADSEDYQLTLYVIKAIKGRVSEVNNYFGLCVLKNLKTSHKKFVAHVEISDNNKITHKIYCKKICDTCKKFLKELFKFFKTITIF